jgi:hypothetical protein
VLPEDAVYRFAVSNVAYLFSLDHTRPIRRNLHRDSE